MSEKTSMVGVYDSLDRMKRDGQKLQMGMFVKKLNIRETTIFFISLVFLVLFLGIFISNPINSYSTDDDVYIPENSIATVSVDDQDLLKKASMVTHHAECSRNCTPKIAFMFLARRGLPLRPLWEMFFKGHQKFYSIYLHTSPNFTAEPPESSVFYKRRIPSKIVEWGKTSMIDAERRLLANALLDCCNERFVLLSESCIPVFNFSTVYSYITNSNLSFLNIYDDPGIAGRGRYNERMMPTVTLQEWRKGSQWFEMKRDIAVEIVSDTKLYPVFRNHCRFPCFADEHYFPTLVTKVSPGLTSNRTITWKDWSSMPKHSPHPRTFRGNEVDESFLNRVRFGTNCSYNGENSSVCHLFARKFHPDTLQPLLSLAPKLLGFSS